MLRLFHPSLADEPLIFIEVALTKDIPSSIQAVLADDRRGIAGGRVRPPPSSTRSAIVSPAYGASRSAIS